MATKTKKPSTKQVCEQALLDEISDLKKQLAESRLYYQNYNEHQQVIAKVIRVGFWEWDEIKGRALSYSAQMAEIFDIDAKDIDTVLQSLKDFEPMVHPEDLELYRENVKLKAGGFPDAALSRIEELEGALGRKTAETREYELEVGNLNTRLRTSEQQYRIEKSAAVSAATRRINVRLVLIVAAIAFVAFMVGAGLY